MQCSSENFHQIPHREQCVLRRSKVFPSRPKDTESNMQSTKQSATSALCVPVSDTAQTAPHRPPAAAIAATVRFFPHRRSHDRIRSHIRSLRHHHDNDSCPRRAPCDRNKDRYHRATLRDRCRIFLPFHSRWSSCRLSFLPYTFSSFHNMIHTHLQNRSDMVIGQRIQHRFARSAAPHQS